MIKTIKKVIIGSFSILGITTLVWIMLLLNPKMVYSHSTHVDNVTIFHNLALEAEAESVVRGALKILSTSAIYDDGLEISMCMNDHPFYPELFPFKGGTMYAFLNKTVVYHCKPNFKENTADFAWAVNNYEERKFNLTYLLAHEFMHNVQHNYDPQYQILSTLGSRNWKLEGHADYIARGFKNDGQLQEKIKNYKTQEQKVHVGVPVFKLADGTIQNLAYYKYSLVIQYLMEEKKLTYSQVCDLDESLDVLFEEMMEWSGLEAK